MVLAALALLAGALVYAPLGSTQGGEPTLSATPPVKLAAPTTTASTTTTASVRPRLPKTGLQTSTLALLGLGLLGAGSLLRRCQRVPQTRRRR